MLLLNVDAVGGARGLPGIPSYTTLPLVFLTAAIAIVAVRNIMRSAYGRSLLAIREDETATESLGINCWHYKTGVFVASAFLAGAAGCLYAHYLQFIHPRTFDFTRSVELVLIVVLGGGTSAGAAIAAIAMTLLPEGLRYVKDILHLGTDPRMVIYALALIAVMLARGGALGGRPRRPKVGDQVA